MRKEIVKTYKYRLYPNEEQKELLEKHFGCTRFVYNRFLFERKDQYQKTGKSHSYYDQCKDLTTLKKQEDYKWLNEINSQSLQQALRHLEKAYTGFFRGKGKYPKFKKKNSKNSFTIPQKARVEGKKLYFPKFKEGIKIVEHRELQGEICYATVIKSTTCKYFVYLTVKQSYNSKLPTNKEVGVDLGVKDLVITSEGTKFKNHKFFNKYKNQLKKAQQHLARKTKGSRRYENQRLKVAKIYEKITNCRSDVLHKISHELVMKYDAVYLEDLNIKGMLKNHKLSRSISDVAWGELVRQLQYKGNWDDTYIHKIFRFYPSSKTCHCCGYTLESLDLNTRTWTCPQCNVQHDRDINASINILLEGQRELSVGTPDYTNGEDIRPYEITSTKANL